MLKFALPLGGLVGALLLFPALSAGQTISIVSGNGQMSCPYCPGTISQGFVPLVVAVTSSTGAPMVKTTVTWSGVRIVGQAPVTTTTTTDSNGQATLVFSAVIPPIGTSFAQTTVTATATAIKASVVFNETTVVPSLITGFAPVEVTLLSPISGATLSGTAGGVSSTKVQVEVFGTSGLLVGGVSGVAVQLVSNSGGPTVSCQAATGQQPGTVLTDSSGMATCTPVFGSKVGNGTYTVVVGGAYASFQPAPLVVTVGPPAIVKTISGNNQSINAGATTPLALVAEVEDLGGNATPGATVTWAVTPQGSATLSSTVSTANSAGQVSTKVTAGNGGTVQVTATLYGYTAAPAIFTVNVNAMITDLQIVSGDNQDAPYKTVFTSPLIVQVNDSGQPVVGVTVSFALVSGSATLGAATAVTNSEGQAQIVVTAGSTAGPVSISATIGKLSQTFNLTVVPPGPVISASGFTNGAGFQKGFISPCSLATIYGTGLANGLQGVISPISFLGVPTLMAGITVQFNGVYAPILNVVNENNQQSVTVQVPCEVIPGNAVTVLVTVGGGSTTVSVPVLTISPGLFQTTYTDGKLRAVLVRPDGSFVSLQNPARRGETIRMYATGLGQTSPAIVTGQTVPLTTDASGNTIVEDMNVNAQVVIGVNNAGVPVVAAKYAYDFVGVYEVQFQVPSDTASGNDAPFAIAVYQGTNLLFGNPSSIPIQ